MFGKIKNKIQEGLLRGYVRSIVKDEKGAEVPEYVMILGFVALIVVVALLVFFDDIKNWINDARGVLHT